MENLVLYRNEGAAGVITINNPPVNVLSAGVPEGMLRALDEGNADPKVEALILIGGGGTFIAGADIKGLDQLFLPGAFTLRDLLPALERSPKPLVAAIHGAALGGGLETALGCHFRVAVPGARLGLPEVKLGLLPGAGGTQRLPRLIGVEPALDLMLSGDPVNADRALELGLIDEILEGELLPAALAFARRVVAQGRALPVISRMTASLAASERADLFSRVRAELKRSAPDQLAPFLILESVENAVTRPFAQGWSREEELFRRCAASPQSRALLQRFFASRAGKKSES